MDEAERIAALVVAEVRAGRWHPEALDDRELLSELRALRVVRHAVRPSKAGLVFLLSREARRRGLAGRIMP